MSSDKKGVVFGEKTVVVTLAGDKPGHPFHGNQFTGGDLSKLAVNDDLARYRRDFHARRAVEADGAVEEHSRRGDYEGSKNHLNISQAHENAKGAYERAREWYAKADGGADAKNSAIKGDAAMHQGEAHARTAEKWTNAQYGKGKGPSAHPKK